MNEIQVISDGDGVALIGDAREIERFLAAEGLPSRDLGLPRLSTALRGGSGAAQVGSELAANSGRWIKLTQDSANKLKKLDPMNGSSDGLSRAVLTQKGKTKHILEFVTKPGAGSLLTNPAVLAGAAGIMTQLAMQQTMDEITDYLATIDAKLDDVLRAQKDAVVADMIGVDFVIEEAMTIREQVGWVSEVTWSKVQATSLTIARTQAYALRQLDALATKVEQTSKVDDLADAAREVEQSAAEWLAVLARCFQLQDAIAVLELDRVMDADPEMVDQHRIGVRAARDNRRELIARTTLRLMARMDAAAGTANAKVLLHPMSSGSVVRSSNHVAASVTGFHELVGIEGPRDAVEARRWAEAFGDVRAKALEAGAGGVDAARSLGGDTRDRARSISGRLRSSANERDPRRRTKDTP